MTRCPEYYQKWEKDPNWCKLCPSSVSQIESYLDWVDLIEEAGGNREFTFVKLPESVARELKHYKKHAPDKLKLIAGNLAEYINDPETKRLDKRQVMNVASGGKQMCTYRERMPPTYETQLRRNEKRIEELQSQINWLRQQNTLLRESIQKRDGESPPAKSPVGDDRVHDTSVTDERPCIVKTVGHDAVRAKLAKGVVATRPLESATLPPPLPPDAPMSERIKRDNLILDRIDKGGSS